MKARDVIVIAVVGGLGYVIVTREMRRAKREAFGGLAGIFDGVGGLSRGPSGANDLFGFVGRAFEWLGRLGNTIANDKSGRPSNRAKDQDLCDENGFCLE